MLNISHATAFAVMFGGLLTAHEVGDNWVQTHYEAGKKGERSPEGRTACLSHVLSYIFTSIIITVGLWFLFDLPISMWGILAGQTVSGITHYWADRRYPLEWLCKKLNVLGKHDFYRLGQPRDGIAFAGQIARSSALPREVVLYKSMSEPVPIPWDNPSLGTGAYALDQSWHKFWLFIAAIVMVIIP